MEEKEPKQKPTTEEVMKGLGRYAIRMEQIIPRDSDCQITPGIERDRTGTISFVSQSKFIARPNMEPLSEGSFNPNHN